jgi:hypothetical protein
MLHIYICDLVYVQNKHDVIHVMYEKLIYCAVYTRLIHA